MHRRPRHEIIRDPIWNNIPLDPRAVALIDTSVVQRLRYVRQLGLAYLVYPGASHSRFEHAVGAYHLAGLALRLLAEHGELEGIAPDEIALVRMAALLHDVGHYPFSHAVEEIGVPHHEVVAESLIREGEVGDRLRETFGATAPDRVLAMIGGRSDGPLAGLISSSLDLDKLEYLSRDAFMCGVPYGVVDVDRLIHSLCVVPHPRTGRPTVGLLEKGLSALEQLLFARYQMYRNVYWHHAVRSATAMYKRLVEMALADGVVDVDTLARTTDDVLLHRLATADRPLLRTLVEAIRCRRLYKRALDVPAAELDDTLGGWIAEDRSLTPAIEDALAERFGMAPGELLLDYPAKTAMLGLDLPVLRRDGQVTQVTSEGWEGAINLPRLSDELYGSARRLRVFVVDRARVRTPIDRDALLAVLADPAGARR
ncbi:MAG: HD domain-containing protein [Gemmatimonadaceae bacterium]|nr:HD domain-containing protein [Gemmatimonadaceae bacterium]